MKRSTIGTGLILILATLLTAPTILSFPDKPSRDESAKAIRATAYEMMKAFLTQDVATFRRHSAKRTLDLVALVYEAVRQDPRYQQELQNARITNADQFLGYFMLGMATQYLQAMPLSPEAAARRVANDSTVTFISDYQARITLGDSQVAQARLLGRQWKIDLTDWLKRPVLKEVKDPELRAKIQKL
ncbi:MAG TPA: hypothetical protein VGL29_21110 [Blastocatellia bacterium]|jgi:VanZ family protein